MMEQFIMVSGIKEFVKAEEDKSISMAQYMKATGVTISHMEKEEWLISTDKFMKDNGYLAKKKVEEYSSKQIIPPTQENG